MHLIKTNKSNQSLKNSWIFGVLGSSFTGWAHFSPFTGWANFPRLPGGRIFPVYRVGAFFPFTGWGHFCLGNQRAPHPVYRVGAFFALHFQQEFGPPHTRFTGWAQNGPFYVGFTAGFWAVAPTAPRRGFGTACCKAHWGVAIIRGEGVG